MSSYSSKTKYNQVSRLRPPDEVSRDLPGDGIRQYVLRSGKAPFLLEKVYYYDESCEKLKQYGEDPDYMEAT